MGQHKRSSKEPFDLSAATATAGAADYLRTGELGKVGGSIFSNALSVVSGIQATNNHDPATTGVAANAERAGVGAAELLWGIAGGPWAVADSLTGGNAGGAMRAGVGGAFAVGDWVSSGFRDTKAMGKFSDSAMRGDYGKFVGTLADRGDRIGGAAHDNFADDYYLSWDAKRIARDGERELERQNIERGAK
jgi:hypothetical protein